MNLIANQIKYGYTQAANFLIGQWNRDQKKIPLKSIQYITKENLMLLDDLLKPICQNKIYKSMASISENVYTDQLDNILHRTYHRTIKVKPADVNPSMYSDFNKQAIM